MIAGIQLLDVVEKHSTEREVEMLRERRRFLFIALVACFLMTNASLAHEEPGMLAEDQLSFAWDQELDALVPSDSEPVEDGLVAENSDLVEEGSSCRDFSSMDLGHRETPHLAASILEGSSLGAGLMDPSYCPGCSFKCISDCAPAGGVCHHTGCYCLCY